MQSEYLKVDEAIEYLKDLLGDFSNRLGCFLHTYNFFCLTLYVSKDEEILELADPITKEFYYESLKKKHPNRVMNMFDLYCGIDLSSIFEDMSFRGKTFYWKSEDFYKNPCFKKLEQDPSKNIVGYLSVSSMDEAIKANAEQLKQKIAELEEENQTQAKIIQQKNEAINKLMLDIDEIEKELPNKSFGAVANLIYALLTELNYDVDSSSNKNKGALCDKIIAATSPYLKQPFTKDFIATWINHARYCKGRKTE